MGKENILNQIKWNKPNWEVKLPDIPGFLEEKMDLVVQFEKHLVASNTTVIKLSEKENLVSVIQEQYPTVQHTVSLVPEVPGTIDIKEIRQPNQLEHLNLAIIKGEIGVADNGALWISNRSTEIRVIPFITRYLVIVIDKSDLVQKMHQAYRKIDTSNLDYGIFISGPSKTADIEQALVVGAHGPLGLTVILRI